MIFLYITDAFAICGGVERVLAEKMNLMAKLYGYFIHFVTVNQGCHPLSYKLDEGVCYGDLQIRMHQQYEYHGIRRIIKRRKLQQLLKLRLEKSICEIKPDIIICVKFDFVGVLLQVKGNIPLVVESHTLCKAEMIDASGWLRKIHVYLFKRKIRKADAVIALTKGDADDWKEINPKAFVIPNVVHLNDSGKLCSCQEKSVIYVGRFSSQKDIHILISIWDIVNKKHPNWQLRIYGDGELKDHFMSIIHRMDANIHVFPATPDIMEKYCENSILLLTSLYEPFGLVLPEAMSCGLPVVSFDCPYGPAEIITDGVDGFLIKHRDVEAFADKVCQLIEDEALRKKMGEAGILSSKRFSADNIMPQWKALFESLVNS